MRSAAFDFRHDAGGNDRQGDELRVAVFERRTGGGAVILEDEDVAEAKIFTEVQHPIPIGPEHVLDFLGRHVGQAVFVTCRFDYDLVGSDPVHPVVETETFAAEIAFDLEGRELIGDDADRPIGRIRFGGQ